jgi:hypothetical protein
VILFLSVVQKHRSMASEKLFWVSPIFAVQALVDITSDDEVFATPAHAFDPSSAWIVSIHVVHPDA